MAQDQGVAEILPPYEDAETQMLTALMYPLWLFFSGPILWLRRGPDHRYARFHAWQALLLGAGGTLALGVAGGLFLLLVKLIPVLGRLGLGISFVIGFSLLTLGWLVLLGYQFLCAYRAQQGRVFELPFIGERARALVFEGENR